MHSHPPRRRRHTAAPRSVIPTLSRHHKLDVVDIHRLCVLMATSRSEFGGVDWSDIHYWHHQLRLYGLLVATQKERFNTLDAQVDCLFNYFNDYHTQRFHHIVSSDKSLRKCYGRMRDRLMQRIGRCRKSRSR